MTFSTADASSVVVVCVIAVVIVFGVIDDVAVVVVVVGFPMLFLIVDCAREEDGGFIVDRLPQPDPPTASM